MHYYQFNIGDYVAATAHLDPLEDLAYRRLLDLYYLEEEALPDDFDLLAKKCRMRTHSECIADVVREFFSLSNDGLWHCDRADAEIHAFRQKSVKAAKSAKERWKKHKKNQKDTVSSERNVNAVRTHSEGNAKHKTLNKKQETSNQDELDSMFDQFWSSGIRKSNKKKSLQIFRKILSTKQQKQEFTDYLIKDIKLRLGSDQLGFAEMHPTTYLNGERWTDEKPRAKTHEITSGYQRQNLLEVVKNS